MSYNADQPRDSNGRWGSGGGSNGRFTRAARERVAMNKQVDERHYPTDSNARMVPGHGMVNRATPVARHDNNESVGTEPHVLALGGHPLDADLAATKQAFDSKYGGMSARQHGAAAKSHWQAANSATGADRAAHIMLGNWHAQSRESLTGRGMKS